MQRVDRDLGLRTRMSTMVRLVGWTKAMVVVVVLVTVSPVTAGRATPVMALGIRAWCIPKTESLLLEHDARHECAYDLRNGDRAVGVRYNLDDDRDTRRSELGTVLADYDKVYKGEDCLNVVQISALLALDTRRALDRAAESVKALDEQCCSVVAVFGDIQHSAGKDAFKGNSFVDFIEAVSAKEWHKAGDQLDGTRWCFNNKERCASDKALIVDGCGKIDSRETITQVTDLNFV